MARPSISDLPDALLTETLSLVEPADLHRAALVSRRWHECAHAPDLCASVETTIRSLRQLRLLLAWLLRHGRHVRRLCLLLWVPAQAAEQLLGSCITACAQLEDLSVVPLLDDQTLLVGDWAPALNRLQRLALRSDGVEVSASLRPLTALRKLCLEGRAGVRLSPGVQLPPGLEELQLEDWTAAQLPKQLAGLSALHTLVLSVDCGPNAYGALERLPRLRRLRCSNCEHLPACLSRLTGLEELMLYSVRNAATLDDALRALTRLTSLALFNMPALQLPPSIAGLARLQRACFGYPLGNPPGGYAVLPVGPWAASLRQLGASYDTLLLSGQLLAAAGQLAQVAVTRVDNATPGDASERFWRWCAEHHPLQQLHIEMFAHRPPEPPFLAAAEGLGGARPALPVHRHVGSSPFTCAFFHEV